MKTKLLNIVIIIMFILGFGIVLYPIISNFVMGVYQTTAIQDYAYTVEQMKKEKTDKILNDAREYNKKINDVVVSDPFLYEAEDNVDNKYKDILNVDGVIGYLEIPKINVKLAIYHGTSEEVLKKGVGHIETTPLPIGGGGNHSVLSAHRGLPSAKLFTDLDKLELGDFFVINILSETLVYKVDQINVVEPTDTKYLQSEENKDYVTLLTCTPYSINSHRLLVRGTRVDNNIYLESNNEELEKNTQLYYLLILVILLVPLCWYIYRRKGLMKNEQ